MSKKVVILGAGPSGLAAALQLVRNGVEVIVIEKESRVGGLSGSIRWGDAILDFGPHAFHVKEGRVVPLVRSLMRNELLEGIRKEYLLMRGRYLQYPVRFYELVFKQSPFLSLRMIVDYLMSSLIYSFIAVPDDSFESWGIKRFGKTLYNMFFGTYTQKVWGIPPRKISPIFAEQKLHKLSLKEVIRKLLGGSGEEQETFWKHYVYPRRGIGALFERIAEEVEKNGGRIILEATPTRICASEKRIVSVEFERAGEFESCPCDVLISSIPIGSLGELIYPPLGEYPLYKARSLKFRSLILVYVSICTERVTDAMWVYLVDSKFRFNRFTEQKNMSPQTCQEGKTIICFEICCNKGDELWEQSDEEIFKMVLEEISSIKKMRGLSIEQFKVVRVENAYPIYDVEFDRNLRVLLDILSSYPNLISIGRAGLFLQNDMHDNMEIGFRAAAFVLEKDSCSSRWYQQMLSLMKI